MGVMQFTVHLPETVDDRSRLHGAYLSGADRRVFPTVVELRDGLLICQREVSETARLNVAWPVEGIGRPVLRTTSLPERDEPYLLPLELARGKIAQVRDQLSMWAEQGMQVSPLFSETHRQSHRLLSQAILKQQTDLLQAGELGQQALVQSCKAAEMLVRAYTRQRLEFRHRRSSQLPALLGCQFGNIIPETDGQKTFCDAFTAASIPIEWKQVEETEGEQHWEISDAQVEWCQDHRLLMYGGPLIDLSAEGLPNWLWQWEHDFLNLQSFVCDFVETAITRYYGKIRHWEISARGNTGGALTLSEEQRLTLVAKTLEVSRHVDDEIELIVGVDQPWGDYQARGQHRLSPFQFVDALLRSGVGLSGVNLEFGMDYHPCGTDSRELLAFSRLIDHWSYLGIPIYVTLAFPSSNQLDLLARHDFEVNRPDMDDVAIGEALQAAWVEKMFPLLMAKESVIGIFWSHFTDAVPHRFPHAGLWRADNTPKPAMEQIVNYRKAYWANSHDE